MNASYNLWKNYIKIDPFRKLKLKFNSEKAIVQTHPNNSLCYEKYKTISKIKIFTTAQTQIKNYYLRKK